MESLLPTYVPAGGPPVHRLAEVRAGRLRTEAVAEWLAGAVSAQMAWLEGVRTERPADALAVAPSPRPLLTALAEALAASSLARPEPPVHLLLSGGLDSSVLLALLARLGARVVAHTLSDPAVDEEEARAAAELCREYAVPQEVQRVGAEDLPEAFERAVLDAERPLHNARGVALALHVRALGERGVARAVSGLGADEVLYGNPAALARPLLAFPELVSSRVAPPPFPGGAQLPALRRLYFDAVFVPRALPPLLNAAHANGVELLLPYLHPSFVSAASALPVSALTDGTAGKLRFREEARALLPPSVASVRKSPRLSTAVVHTAASARWRDRLAPLLTAEALGALRVVDVKRATAVWSEYWRLCAGDPRADWYDAQVLTLASLVVLARAFPP